MGAKRKNQVKKSSCEQFSDSNTDSSTCSPLNKKGKTELERGLSTLKNPNCASSPVEKSSLIKSIEMDDLKNVISSQLQLQSSKLKETLKDELTASISSQFEKQNTALTLAMSDLRSDLDSKFEKLTGEVNHLKQKLENLETEYSRDITSLESKLENLRQEHLSAMNDHEQHYRGTCLRVFGLEIPPNCKTVSENC